MRKHREPTRTREEGRKVTDPRDFANQKLARISALREIVQLGAFAKVDGVMVDLFSASAIVKVYDALGDENKAKFSSLPVWTMQRMAFQLLK